MSMAQPEPHRRPRARSRARSATTAHRASPSASASASQPSTPTTAPSASSQSQSSVVCSNRPRANTAHSSTAFNARDERAAPASTAGLACFLRSPPPPSDAAPLSFLHHEPSPPSHRRFLSRARDAVAQGIVRRSSTPHQPLSPSVTRECDPTSKSGAQPAQPSPAPSPLPPSRTHMRPRSSSEATEWLEPCRPEHRTEFDSRSLSDIYLVPPVTGHDHRSFRSVLSPRTKLAPLPRLRAPPSAAALLGRLSHDAARDSDTGSVNADQASWRNTMTPAEMAFEAELARHTTKRLSPSAGGGAYYSAALPASACMPEPDQHNSNGLEHVSESAFSESTGSEFLPKSPSMGTRPASGRHNGSLSVSSAAHSGSKRQHPLQQPGGAGLIRPDRRPVSPADFCADSVPFPTTHPGAEPSKPSSRTSSAASPRLSSKRMNRKSLSPTRERAKPGRTMPTSHSSWSNGPRTMPSPDLSGFRSPPPLHALGKPLASPFVLAADDDSAAPPLPSVCVSPKTVPRSSRVDPTQPMPDFAHALTHTSPPAYDALHPASSPADLWAGLEATRAATILALQSYQDCIASLESLLGRALALFEPDRSVPRLGDDESLVSDIQSALSVPPPHLPSTTGGRLLASVWDRLDVKGTAAPDAAGVEPRRDGSSQTTAVHAVRDSSGLDNHGLEARPVLSPAQAQTLAPQATQPCLSRNPGSGTSWTGSVGSLTQHSSLVSSATLPPGTGESASPTSPGVGAPPHSCGLGPMLASARTVPVPVPVPVALSMPATQSQRATAIARGSTHGTSPWDAVESGEPGAGAGVPGALSSPSSRSAASLNLSKPPSSTSRSDVWLSSGYGCHSSSTSTTVTTPRTSEAPSPGLRLAPLPSTVCHGSSASATSSTAAGPNTLDGTAAAIAAQPLPTTPSTTTDSLHTAPSHAPTSRPESTATSTSRRTSTTSASIAIASMPRPDSTLLPPRPLHSHPPTPASLTAAPGPDAAGSATPSAFTIPPPGTVPGTGRDGPHVALRAAPLPSLTDSSAVSAATTNSRPLSPALARTAAAARASQAISDRDAALFAKFAQVALR